MDCRSGCPAHPGRSSPDLGSTQFARLLGYSRSWVKKWLKRLREASPHDLEVLRSHSRARHTLPPAYDPSVVQRIIDIRVQPPEGLQRIPGPRTILYYFHRDPDLRREGARLPRSPRTIWRLLHQTGLLVEQEAHEHHLLPRPGPLQEVQIDFKDASTVCPDPSEPGSKQQHVVEICNAVDAGTSIWLDA